MRSLWLEEALTAAEDAPRLEGDERADICIVGGGFTGLWTAIRLKEHDPSLDVVLVEADVCGAGASGRNGGFVLTWWAKFGTLKKVCGGDEAIRLARASAQAVDGIGAFCAEHGIDAHYRRDGWLWAATSEAQLGAWEETLARRSRTTAKIRSSASNRAKPLAGRARRRISAASTSRRPPPSSPPFWLADCAASRSRVGFASSRLRR